MVVGRKDSVDFIDIMAISTSHLVMVSRLSVKSINQLEELFVYGVFQCFFMVSSLVWHELKAYQLTIELTTLLTALMGYR